LTCIRFFKQPALFMLLLGFMSADLVSASTPKNIQVLKHLSHVKEEARYLAKLESQAILTTQKKESKGHWFRLPLKKGELNINVQRISRHLNGDLSFSQAVNLHGKSVQVLYTQGEGVGIGEIIGNDTHLYFEQRGQEVHVIDITRAGLLPGLYENDTLGKMEPRPKSVEVLARDISDPVIVDIMLLYTQNIQDTFSGALTETLLNQLILKANQAFVDSNISMQLRLVHMQFVDYTQPSDFSALDDLQAALEGTGSIGIDPALIEVASLRDQFGADVVSMIRTHDLNEREVCGVARFPSNSSDILINISNVGISGGSNCINTFTHEIGHNFGAGHQAVNGQSVGVLSFSGAMIQQGKLNTLMSSIGTGDINRNFKLNQFSNPDIVCGGLPCGEINSADNARTINQFAAINSELRSAVLTTDITISGSSSLDRDGDGIADSQDAYPFDATETHDSDLDGVGDINDAFPFDPAETQDTDNDGQGNNQDLDDDNDNIKDTTDALPLDAQESVDADGDGVGANNDALDNNFQESMDADQDQIGDLNDLDDDNDGVNDFFQANLLINSEIWVASAGTDQMLRFDAQTGDFIEVGFSVEPGGISFRTDMFLNNAQQLFFIAFSDIYRFDRQTLSIQKVIDRSQLQSNFPVHINLDTQQNLWVNNGLGTSYLEAFSLTETGNFFSASTNTELVFRDMLFDGNRLLVLARSANQLHIYDLSNISLAPQILSPQGLNKPEYFVMDGQSNIFVANAGSKNISQFDGLGNFLGELIAAGTGGLGTPSCLAIGPEGNLYVCSGDTNEILKFDSTSGTFLGIAVDAGAAQLTQPVSIVFAGKVLDSLRFSGEHDSDDDGVNNNQDSFPLDNSEITDTDNDGVGNNMDTDDDNDGMPDQYEIDNNLNSLDGADASQDADNDGSSNFEEFSAGTDPNSASSVQTPAEPPLSPVGDSGGGSLPMSTLILLILLRIYRCYLSRHRTF
jgi:hypothetical protein